MLAREPHNLKIKLFQWFSRLGNSTVSECRNYQEIQAFLSASRYLFIAYHNFFLNKA